MIKMIMLELVRHNVRLSKELRQIRLQHKKQLQDFRRRNSVAGCSISRIERILVIEKHLVVMAPEHQQLRVQDWNRNQILRGKHLK